MRPQKGRAVIGVEDGFDFDAAYRYGRIGCAWVVWGWEQVFEPNTYLALDPETGEEFETQGDGEWIDDPSRTRVLVRMVGDDRYEVAERSDLEKIDDLAYCCSCGQLGCTADGRDR